LVEGSDGKLYGTNHGGGQFGEGTIFRIALDDSYFENLHSFDCSVFTNGCFPSAALIKASDGKMYGTTEGGGAFGGGTVFKIDSDGAGFQQVFFFRCGFSGCTPRSPLVEGSDGKLYGTNHGGGQFGEGTIFRIALDGSDFALLHSFACDGDDGCSPLAGLIQASDGRLYGTTSAGGKFDSGTVYRITLSEIVNDKVNLVVQSTSFNPTYGGPAGVFIINAILTNESTENISAPIKVVVATLTNGNKLTSATEGDGGVGSKQGVSAGSDNVLKPNESVFVPLTIGLASRSKFSFFVNVEGGVVFQP
jgi:uncharacterized repeat protein (TIGR03803 family)